MALPVGNLPSLGLAGSLNYVTVSMHFNYGVAFLHFIYLYIWLQWVLVVACEIFS